MLFEGVTELVGDGMSQLRHGLIVLGKLPELENSELAIAVEWAAQLCTLAQGFTAQVKQHVDTRAESETTNEALGSVSRRLRDSLGSMAAVTQEMSLAVNHASTLPK